MSCFLAFAAEPTRESRNVEDRRYAGLSVEDGDPFFLMVDWREEKVVACWIFLSLVVSFCGGEEEFGVVSFDMTFGGGALVEVGCYVGSG